MPTKTKAKPAKKTATSKAAKQPTKASADTGTKRKPGKAETLVLDPPAPKPAPAGKASVAVAYQTEETTLLLTQLTPGPWQDRTEFPEAYLGELAASIEEHGILQRIWARPKDKPGKKGETHDIIAGECRWRAAQQTRHLVVPVKIFHCTPAQAKVLSIIENLQRENLNPLDEAHGFRKLQEEGWSAWDPEHPETSIGHKVGKSKTYIYSALKLTELNKTGQAAVRSGELSASVGIRIARIPNPEQQKKALEWAVQQNWTDAEAADRIARQFMTELKGAPFDRKDETLNPERGSCEKCPFRSGNQAELYADMAKGRADICTDPVCFRKKCAVAFDRRADAHEEAGGKVLSAKEAEAVGLNKNWSSIGGKWVNLNKVNHNLPGKLDGKIPAELLKAELKADPTLITLAKANDGSGETFEIMEQAALMKLLKQSGKLSKETKESSSPQKDYEREAKERKKLETELIRWQLAQVDAAARTAKYSLSQLHRVMVDWLIDTRGKDAIRHVVEGRQLDVKAFKLTSDSPGEHVPRSLRAHAAELPPEQIPSLLVELLVTPEWTREGELPERAHPLLKLIGLDPFMLLDQALGVVPGGAEILAERKLLATLTEPIAEILGSVPEGAMNEDEIMERLEKAGAFKAFGEDLIVDGLGDWWKAAGQRDGRIEKQGWDRYRLKPAAAPQI